MPDTDPALQERERIVRWMRWLAERHGAIEAGERKGSPLYEHAMSTRIAYEMGADAIARGDHLGV